MRSQIQLSNQRARHSVKCLRQRGPKTGVKLPLSRHATQVGASLKHRDPLTRARQDNGANQPVVPTANNDRVLIRHMPRCRSPGHM